MCVGCYLIEAALHYAFARPLGKVVLVVLAWSRFRVERPGCRVELLVRVIAFSSCKARTERKDTWACVRVHVIVFVCMCL
jgi:hypothetical protein